MKLKTQLLVFTYVTLNSFSGYFLPFENFDAKLSTSEKRGENFLTFTDF